MSLYGKNATGGGIGFRDIENSGADVNLNIATMNGVTYGYNGIATIKEKTKFSKKKANGIMFW